MIHQLIKLPFVKILLVLLIKTGCLSDLMLAQLDTTNLIEQRLKSQLENYPQEKIYLQTDKFAYLSGERIWLRTHLVDALTHQPAFLSRYVYVELISPMDDLIERIMIRPDSTGAYSGHIDLADDLIEGDYTMRAYTRFMRNKEEELFSKKRVKVLDPFSLQIDPRLSFDVAQNSVKTGIVFIDRQNGDTIVPEIVSCKLTHKQEKILKPNKDKSFSWNVNLTSKIENRTMLLSLSYKGRKYSKFYTIPYDETDFDVQFFPEGGYLIPESTCQVGFKAMNPAGLGETISGKLYNSDDEKIMDFKSLHLGMGFFNFLTQAGQSYYVVCENNRGITKRFDLPAAEPNAIVLSVRVAGNRIIAAILGNENIEREKIQILIHHKGRLVYLEPLKSQTEAYIFPLEGMPHGILSLMLVDENQNILSERLLFNVDKSRLPDLHFDTAANSYHRREKIDLLMKLTDKNQNPMRGNFAVSVTDKNSVLQDSTVNMVSTLLLSSELSGYIESPASYFDNEKINKHALDALMMTQGWRRYNLPQVLKGKIAQPEEFGPELSQRITGKADGLFGSLKAGDISLMATMDSLVSTVTTTADNKGRFAFDVEYPAGTSILVQSLSKRGSKINSINLDVETFPDVLGAAVPVRSQFENRQNMHFDNYLQQADEEYTKLHGIRTILLDEVTVVAKTVEKYKESTFYSPLAATGLRTAEDIEKMKPSSFRTFLYAMPGVIVRSDRVTSTRSETPILFVIDDMRFDDFFDRLDDIDVNSIESIFVVRDNSMMPGYYPGTDGAIVITTKIGFTPKPRKSPNIDKIVPLGYQQAAEFFSPAYDTLESATAPQSDLRTTLFWKPNLQFEEDGTAQIEFYAADLPTTYQVIVEGASDTGAVVSKKYEILIEEHLLR